MRNLKSGFILSYISIFIQSIISILYTPVMLRLLGESNYGLLQLAISTMSSLSILSFGFGSSYMRFYSQYKADNDNNAISVLNGMFTIIFISVSILSPGRLSCESIYALNSAKNCSWQWRGLTGGFCSVMVK